MSRATGDGIAVRLDHVSKVHGVGEGATQALRDVSLDVQAGEFVSIMGPSGCGKSTLLNLIGGLDRPSSGTVTVAGIDLASASEAQRCALRASRVGFIFQSFNLLPRLNLFDNVSWRLDDLGVSRAEVRTRTAAVLEQVGIKNAAWDRYPSELSGGEQQRAAAARALVTDPDLVLADEPTGNLDSSTGEAILSLLRDLNVRRAMSVVLVTHDTYAATFGHRTIALRDGWIVDEVSGPRRERADVVRIVPSEERESGE